MIFDTHAHYDDERFDADRETLLSALPAAGIGLVVNPGCDRRSSEAAVALAARFSHVYAAVGWHPENLADWTEDAPGLIRSWCRNPRVRAIGEIGLDYYFADNPPREVQQRVLRTQMALAEELGMRVIIHDREAHGDCMAIVREFPRVTGVFHCYAGSPEMAEELLARGWYLSFTGSVTFKNARRAPETIRICPLDRIMVETDSPYLAPVPHRGERNDSRNLPLVIDFIARTRGIPYAEAENAVWENSLRFFGVSAPD